MIQRHEPAKTHGTGSYYSKVVEANGFVFTAGVVASDLEQDARGQTEQILVEIDRLLRTCGADWTRVVSAMMWVSDIRHREPMNDAWIALTRDRDLPARVCVEAKLADPRIAVEIAVVAVK